ncbi:MAG: N-acetylneuraminate synthase family protein [Pirellulales bacterium]
MSAKTICLAGGRTIGPGAPVLVVAEIGQNHNGSLAIAEQLIDAAAWAGADAVKFVKRDLASELCREASRRPYTGRHAFGSTYGEHRRALELSAEDHARLCRRARGLGLIYLATACDLPSARLLETLSVEAFKVASRDLANLPLLEYVASRGRPVFLSTGMSAWPEIDEAVAVLTRHAAPFILLQCTSLYPTPDEHVHLASLPALAARYGVPAGFSDHSLGGLLPAVAVGLGAVLIEKHLSLDRNMKGTDHACSLEPDEFQRMVAGVRRVERAMGRADKPLAPGVDRIRVKLGRSLVTRIDLPAGTQLEEPMLTLKSPGDGLSWLDRRLVLGRRLKRSIPADEKLSMDDLV